MGLTEQQKAYGGTTWRLHSLNQLPDNQSLHMWQILRLHGNDQLPAKKMVAHLAAHGDCAANNSCLFAKAGTFASTLL